MAISLSHAERRIAQRARMLNGSVIREILKLTEWPHMISFAGGIPSPTTFPLATLRDATTRAVRPSNADTLQYSATEVYAPLREWIAREHSIRAAPLEHAITVNVAFVPGAPFFAVDPLHHYLRLSFATVSPQRIDCVIERRAALINAYTLSFTPVLDLDYDR